MPSILIAMAALAASAQGAKPAERARTNLGSYFSSDDYPASAARRGVEGVVRFKLRIEPDGRVSKCDITRSSGDAALDSTTCSVLLGRAQYSPARGNDGRPIAGSDSGSVTWRLPPPLREPFDSVEAPALISITVGVDAARRPLCSVLLNGGSAGAEGEALCASIGEPSADLLARVPANAAVDLDIAIGLENELPAPAGVGRLMMDKKARFDVDGDGRISNCTVAETNLHDPMPSEMWAPDLCAFPAFQRPLFPRVEPGAPPRRGEIRYELRLRTGGAPTA